MCKLIASQQSETEANRTHRCYLVMMMMVMMMIMFIFLFYSLPSLSAAVCVIRHVLCSTNSLRSTAPKGVLPRSASSSYSALLSRAGSSQRDRRSHTFWQHQITTIYGTICVLQRSRSSSYSTALSRAAAFQRDRRSHTFGSLLHCGCQPRLCDASLRRGFFVVLEPLTSSCIPLERR